MAWESKPTMRRPSENATSISGSHVPLRPAQASPKPNHPESSHLADPFIHNFLEPNFDPAHYLDSVLAPLHPSSGRAPPGAVPLAELSAQAQAQISQLNAHTIRLSSTLTQLTDDILRSGSRLAYEVELLRGETVALAEALTEGLHGEVGRFAPREIPRAGKAPLGQEVANGGKDALLIAREPAGSPDAFAPVAAPDEPTYIAQLRTLTVVRARLEAVIKVFGDAMEFVFPPSELSVSSAFLSVSAPDVESNHSTEEKGRQVLARLREEVSRLLSHEEDPMKGIENAVKRIEVLKELNVVWNGTAEEKGRAKFVDSLARMVEDRHRELLKEMEQAHRKDGASADLQSGLKKGLSADGDAPAALESKPYGGYGLISQLQKLRGGH